MVCVGKPVLIVLICKVTGRLFVDFDLKKMSHFVAYTPFGSATSNDSASGSTHLVWVTVLFINEVLATSLVSVSDVFLSSVFTSLEISALRIRSVVDSTLSNVPLDEKLVSAELWANPEIVELVELVVSVNVLFPVVNTGVDGEVGSGINNDPIKDPELSLITLRFFISAIDPLVCPIKRIPLEMHP